MFDLPHQVAVDGARRTRETRSEVCSSECHKVFSKDGHETGREAGRHEHHENCNNPAHRQYPAP